MFEEYKKFLKFRLPSLLRKLIQLNPIANWWVKLGNRFVKQIGTFQDKIQENKEWWLKYQGL